MFSCKTFPPRYKDAQAQLDTELIIDQKFQYPSELNNCSILEAKINGDYLLLDIEFTGGCEQHRFNLYFNEVLMKSMPPKATLFLNHIDNNDKCESIVQKTLKFNIKKLKEKSNEMYIYLVGYSKSLKY